MKTESLPVSPFRKELSRQMRLKQRELRANDPSAAVSVDCFMQLVNPPSNLLEGAPQGTNARYFYAQMFRELCAGNSPFIIR